MRGRTQTLLQLPTRCSLLRYLWIEKVTGSSNQIVYVPSDGGLPVLEAGRLKAPTAQ